MSAITKYMNNCILCGKPNIEIHHCCYGRGIRELADEDALTIPLCRECHEELHKNGVAGKLSKIIGQLAYEKHLVANGRSEDIARECFRKRYGRSYL